jgi:hypothetical protein
MYGCSKSVFNMTDLLVMYDSQSMISKINYYYTSKGLTLAYVLGIQKLSRDVKLS